MLAERYLVMPDLDLQSHAVERVHQFGAHAHGLVAGREVEIAAHIMRHRVNARAIVLTTFEQEEFRLGTHVQRPATLGDYVAYPFQGPARIALERVAIGCVNITEHPSAFAFLSSPGQHRVRIGVEYQAHVRFLDAGEALHRRAVEPHAFFQCTFQPPDGHVHRLDRAGHI
jgi:uncharacterized protein YoaH (UPF0181 family)